MREHRELAELVHCTNEKIIAKKDPNKPYVGLEHIPQRGSEITEHSHAGDSISTNSVFRESDVLFGKLRPNLRKCVLARFAGYCSTDILVLRALPGASPSYAVRVLQSEQVGAEAEKTAIGTKMPRTSWASLKNVKVFAPSISQQQKIAQILDTLDTQIQKTEALIPKLEKIKEGLLHDLLTRGIDQNGQLRPTPEQAPELYKESVLGLIPREWDISTLGDSSISSVIGPFGSDLVASDYRSEGVPVVFVRDIAGAQYDRVSQVFVSPRKAQALSAHEVTAGDLLLTKMGLPPCISAVYPKREPAGIITADIVRLRLKADVAPEWAHHYVNSEAVKSQVRGITAGVTRPKVTLKDARSLRIAVPDIEEQARILSILQRSSSRLESESASLAKLRAQKSGLMDDLLTGRTRVTSLLKDSI